jgi:hypothetical protein
MAGVEPYRVYNREIPAQHLFAARGRVVYSATDPSAVGTEVPLLVFSRQPQDFEGTDVSSLRYLPSRLHGRSMEEGNPVTPLEKKLRVVHGQLVSSTSYKGATLTNPEVMPSPIQPDGIFVRGMLFESLTPRMIASSNFFLTHGIAAEQVEEIYTLTQVPGMVDGKVALVPIEHLKDEMKRQVHDDWLNLKYAQAINPDEFASIIASNEFAVVKRVMPIAERLQDLTIPATPEEFEDMMRKITVFITAKEKFRAEKDPAYLPQQLATKDFLSHPEHFFDYLAYVGAEIGTKMARSHANGVVLHNGSAHNFPADGSICDLESPRGAALHMGDARITPNDERADIQNLLFGKNVSTVNNLNFGMLQTLAVLATRSFAPREFTTHKLFGHFAQHFLTAYAAEKIRPLQKDIVGGTTGWLIPLLQQTPFSPEQQEYLTTFAVLPMLAKEVGFSLVHEMEEPVADVIIRAKFLESCAGKLADILISLADVTPKEEGVEEFLQMEGAMVTDALASRRPHTQPEPSYFQAALAQVRQAYAGSRNNAQGQMIIQMFEDFAHLHML